MKCLFELGPIKDGRRVAKCSRCGKVLNVPESSGFNVQRECHVPGTGPGTELTRLIRKWGVTATSTCRCQERANQMDAWGPSGCREHRDTILAWLKESYAEAEISTAVRSAIAVASWFGDPFEWLIDEAIRCVEVPN